jgi:hypothetical protein
MRSRAGSCVRVSHGRVESGSLSESTNTETTKVAVISDVESKSAITRGTPGAKKEEPSGVRRVRQDRTAMFILVRSQCWELWWSTVQFDNHFFFALQLSGFSGSCSPSQSTMLGSCSVSVTAGSFTSSPSTGRPFSSSCVVRCASEIEDAVLLALPSSSLFGGVVWWIC